MKMIRKFNYTGRQKLKHSDITINLEEVEGLRIFNASIDLEEYNLPPEAVIYIEPYYKSSFMRFNFGTVGNFQHPDIPAINDIPNSDIVLFRVKVVDESNIRGRILAIADQIRPKNLVEESVNKQSILWVDFGKDLGQEIWKMSFNNIMPTLEINNRLENSRELLKSDDSVFALIYPSAVKEVALKLAFEEEFEDRGDGWQSLWMKFIKLHLSVTHLPDDAVDEDKMNWVDDVASAFCHKYSVRKRFESSKIK